MNSFLWYGREFIVLRNCFSFALKRQRRWTLSLISPCFDNSIFLGLISFSLQYYERTMVCCNLQKSFLTLWYFLGHLCSFYLLFIMLANCLFMKTVFSQFTHFLNYFCLIPFSSWTLKSWLELGFFRDYSPNNQKYFINLLDCLEQLLILS